MNADLPAPLAGLHYEPIPEGQPPVAWYVPVEDNNATVPAIDYPLKPRPLPGVGTAAPPAGKT